jgi:hypothetical protein
MTDQEHIQSSQKKIEKKRGDKTGERLREYIERKKASKSSGDDSQSQG